MKKTVFTLNINNYAPEIVKMTYPLLRYWSHKIGADFYIIQERNFPDWPIVYEKLQIYDLGRRMGNDWNIFVDSDAIIHPETLDWTLFLSKDTVAHNGTDMANIRWRYNEWFRRDGRHIGSCNWFAIASDWCLDLWRPLEMTFSEALDCIFPTINEMNTNVIIKDHLIDDFALSCNIARFGLKFTTLQKIQEDLGMKEAGFHWHIYEDPIDIKVSKMKELIKAWRIPEYILKDYAE